MKFKLKTVNLKSLGELLNSDDEYDPKMIQMILNLKRGLTLKVNHSWLKKKDLNVPSVTQPSDGGVDLRAIPSHNIQDSSNFLSVGGASNPKESLKSTVHSEYDETTTESVDSDPESDEENKSNAEDNN